MVHAKHPTSHPKKSGLDPDRIAADAKQRAFACFESIQLTNGQIQAVFKPDEVIRSVHKWAGRTNLKMYFQELYKYPRCNIELVDEVSVVDNLGNRKPHHAIVFSGEALVERFVQDYYSLQESKNKVSVRT